MRHITHLTLFTAALMASLAAAQQAHATSYAYSPQDVLIGVNNVQALGDYGKGIVFADIDTGVAPQWIGFTPSYNGQGIQNISTTQSAVCLNGTCTTGTPTDGNGHGTFTASEIVGAVTSAGMSGVAPGGSLFSVQVLNANGSGTFADVANGIQYAANHGAQVLNLSLGPGYNNSLSPSQNATQLAAAYSSLAGAINYAASKGVYLVFAGGNDAKNFAGGGTITGLTNTAIQHMLIMGSTSASEKLSTFSNTPGSGFFLSTTGQKYNYDSMWLMADGENIIGASNLTGTITNPNGSKVNCGNYGCITQMSGTSMAAPQGTGAIGLLLAEWPILGRNGTAASVLEATGTNIGVNTSYGDGFMNLTKAFQPIGGTYVIGKTGSNIALTSLNSTVLTGGALGSLSSITSLLSSYTIFDSFQRNFLVNLSNLVTARPSVSAASLAVTAPRITASTSHFADGSSLAFGNMEQTSSFTNPTNDAANNGGWFMSFTDASGSTVAAGSGFPASASFAGAMWGNGDNTSSIASSLGVSNALTNLAEGGAFAAYGTSVGGDTRVAFSWSQTQGVNKLANTDYTQPSAHAFSAGMSTRMTENWKAGFTFGMLNEQNGLLGTTYASNGAVNFGNENRSMSMGLSSSFDLGNKRNLLIDAAIVRSNGANLGEGIISSISPLYARSYGAALVQQDSFDKGDNLSLTVKAPLRVYAGSANLAMTSVDGSGNPVTVNQRVNIRPDGSELDLTVGYQAPVKDNMSWNVSVEGRHNPDNIAGTSDVSALLGASLTF